jgi:hypothetical protein
MAMLRPGAARESTVATRRLTRAIARDIVNRDEVKAPAKDGTLPIGDRFRSCVGRSGRRPDLFTGTAS